MGEMKLPHIALGAWSWGADAAGGDQRKLSPEEVARLEALGHQTKVSTLREWEKEMT